MNIRPAIYFSFFSSLYFLKEIQENSTSIIIFVNAYLLQWVHDWICFIFFNTIYSKSVMNLLYLNILHSIIMIQFCYYKRCVITLMYNWMLNIPMCNRYIPIWQRCFNLIHEIQGIYVYQMIFE